jgi:hypothetical protein
MKAKALEISTEEQFPQVSVHKAFNLGRMFGMGQARVSQHLWCCAGDSHKKLHGLKTALDSTFAGTSYRYPGDTTEFEFCTCTVFPAEVVRSNAMVPVVKKS